MRRIILGALAAAAMVAFLPGTAEAQGVRPQRRAEIRQRMEQRRAEIWQRMEQRRPMVAQKLRELRAQGVKVRPVAARRIVQRRLRVNRPELFERLDLNKDGVLSREEFMKRTRRVGRL